MVLDGRQFFATEILPVLALAANDAMAEYNDTEDAAWLSANVSIVSVKVRLNALALEDDTRINGGMAPLSIRKGNPLWSEVDSVLVPVREYEDVQWAVSQLPRDVGELAAGASWARPVLVLGIVAGLGFLGYQWARK